MIQRIQTLFLLLAVAALVGALFCPWGTFFGSDGSAYCFGAFAVSQQVGSGMNPISFWALGALLCISALVTLVCIFLFRNRLLQIRLSVFNMLLLTGFYLVYIIFLFVVKSRLEADFGFNTGMALPFVALVFDFLAIRAIFKDEKKVRAYQRIR